MTTSKKSKFKGESTDSNSELQEEKITKKRKLCHKNDQNEFKFNNTNDKNGCNNSIAERTDCEKKIKSANRSKAIVSSNTEVNHVFINQQSKQIENSTT